MSESIKYKIGNKKVVIKTDRPYVISNKDTRIIYAKGVIRVPYFPSVNSMYILARNRKILSPEAHEIRNDAWNQLAKLPLQTIPDDGTRLRIELGFFIQNSINQKDTDNCIKFIQDTLAEYYEFNDNRVFHISAYKKQLIDSDSDLLYFKILRDDSDFTPISMSELSD